jgi:class 3 adenylate cyclase
VTGVFPSLLANAMDPVSRADDLRLTRFVRLISLDRRGIGMSDPVPSGDSPVLEQHVGDVVAVMDAAGAREAALWGGADGGQVAALFAAMYPERTSALVLSSAHARWFRAEDYPIGPDPADREHYLEIARRRWGDLDNPWGIMVAAPSRANDPTYRRLYARLQQVSASKSAAASTFFGLNADNDVRAILPLVQARTLVLCPTAPSSDVVRHAEYLAAHIPNARLAQYPSSDSRDVLQDPATIALVEEFLTGTSVTPLSDRILATILFTDIVASTEHLASSGDEQWRSRLDLHDAMVRAHLERFRGREVNTTGDGFFATFDGPARAVRCARAIIDGAHSLGVDARAGVHVGECEVRGDDLTGIAVHIGARVCALANPGEVFTTTTVRDLVAGSGIEFTERGQHTLKGVPGDWMILAATP